MHGKQQSELLAAFGPLKSLPKNLGIFSVEPGRLAESQAYFDGLRRLVQNARRK